MKTIAHFVAGVVLIGMGMVGLYFKVDYSGWVVALGFLAVLCA